MSSKSMIRGSLVLNILNPFGMDAYFPEDEDEEEKQYIENYRRMVLNYVKSPVGKPVELDDIIREMVRIIHHCHNECWMVNIPHIDVQLEKSCNDYILQLILDACAISCVILPSDLDDFKVELSMIGDVERDREKLIQVMCRYVDGMHAENIVRSAVGKGIHHIGKQLEYLFSNLHEDDCVSFGWRLVGISGIINSIIKQIISSRPWLPDKGWDNHFVFWYQKEETLSDTWIIQNGLVHGVKLWIAHIPEGEQGRDVCYGHLPTFTATNVCGRIIMSDIDHFYCFPVPMYFNDMSVLKCIDTFAEINNGITEDNIHYLMHFGEFNIMIHGRSEDCQQEWKSAHKSFTGDSCMRTLTPDDVTFIQPIVLVGLDALVKRIRLYTTMDSATIRNQIKEMIRCSIGNKVSLAYIQKDFRAYTISQPFDIPSAYSYIRSLKVSDEISGAVKIDLPEHDVRYENLVDILKCIENHATCPVMITSTCDIDN